MIKFSKITERQSRGVPTVKADRWHRRVLQKSFVYGHVHRRRMRNAVIKNVERGKHRHLASGAAIHFRATWRPYAKAARGRAHTPKASQNKAGVSRRFCT